jgi:hypothetical protein
LPKVVRFVSHGLSWGTRRSWLNFMPNFRVRPRRSAKPGEALANCAEHGHVNGTDIDVRCRYDGHELCVEIKDAGQGFERWNTCEGAKPLANALRGYGTYIMRRLMDEIEYTERGTRIRLVKRVAGARSAAAGEQAERTEMFG